MGETVNIDDDVDRWRWVCPAGHRNWEPTNHHFWCQQCALDPQKEPVFHELHDLRRDRTVGRDDLQLVTDAGTYRDVHGKEGK